MTASLAFCTFADTLVAQSWECVMTSKCLDAEACTEKTYRLGLGKLGNQFLLSDIAGERPMSEVAVLDDPAQMAFVSSVQDTVVGLFSLYRDGRAHYTLHSPDFSARYSGTCEAHS
ncbi:hypothetical protein [Planktotalea arctica]|uniref:hypothetical protein n=1 Tax=Planktotalea arctica TaxID=1481893 RepID=UPI00111C410B|nr:hypothetical protein [Planktotalea arctica]